MTVPTAEQPPVSAAEQARYARCDIHVWASRDPAAPITCAQMTHPGVTDVLASPAAQEQLTGAPPAAETPRVGVLDTLRPDEPIQIRGGEVRLTYTFEGLAELEDRFGSVAGIQQVLDMDPDRPLFRPLAELVYCGLCDWEARPAFGPEFLRLLLPDQLAQYIVAAGAAVEKAFGPLVQLGEAAAQEQATGTSPGQSGTTPAPSSSVEPTPHGGG